MDKNDDSKPKIDTLEEKGDLTNFELDGVSDMLGKIILKLLIPNLMNMIRGIVLQR